MFEPFYATVSFLNGKKFEKPERVTVFEADHKKGTLLISTKNGLVFARLHDSTIIPEESHLVQR